MNHSKYFLYCCFPFVMLFYYQFIFLSVLGLIKLWFVHIKYARWCVLLHEKQAAIYLKHSLIQHEPMSNWAMLMLYGSDLMKITLCGHFFAAQPPPCRAAASSIGLISHGQNTWSYYGYFSFAKTNVASKHLNTVRNKLWTEREKCRKKEMAIKEMFCWIWCLFFCTDQ